MQVVKVLIDRDDLGADQLEQQFKLALSHLADDVQVYVEPAAEEDDEDEIGEDDDGDSSEEIADDSCPACGRPLLDAEDDLLEEDEERDEGDYLAAFKGEADDE